MAVAAEARSRTAALLHLRRERIAGLMPRYSDDLPAAP